MASADERLIVMLEARVTEFEKRMRKAEQTGTRTYQGLRRNSRSATRGMERDMSRSTTAVNRALATTSSKIGMFGKAFAVGIGATITAGLTSNIMGTVKGIAQLGDEAERAGIGLESFQEWKFVAEQNRISVDALVDGFKELSLRADEFVVTGAGPAAEAFTRIGLTADQLKKALKDPDELMKDIIDRMQNLDRAAQIRVSDELFGGSAGERFVELLDEGREGIEATMQAARDAGVVLDAEMVEKAAELDRRFHELQATVGGFFKRVAVGAADAIASIFSLQEELDKLFDNPNQGRNRLGDDTYGALDENSEAADKAADDIKQLNIAYDDLMDRAQRAGQAMAGATAQMRAWGYDGAAGQVAQLSEQLRKANDDFEAGTITGDEFSAKLVDIQKQAVEAFNALSDVDRPEFSNVIAGINGLGNAIAGAVSLAKSLKGAIAEVAGVGDADAEALRKRHEAEQASMDSMEAQREAKEDFLRLEDEQNAKTADRLKLEREIESIRNRAKGAGATLTQSELERQARENLDAIAARSGGDGGSSRKGRGRRHSFEGQIERTQERIAEFKAEAAALVVVAQAGQQYGNSVDYARKRAELLNAAMREGREITPELRAEIDQLAKDYATAGLEAEEAAERMEEIEGASERGEKALENLFGSILDGSMSAKEAVGQLLAEIAKAQLMKGIMGLPGMGGVATAIGGLLGYASGGYTGNAPADEIAGVVHGGEYVFSKDAVKRLGVGTLEALHKGKGFMDGGLVPSCEGGAELIIGKEKP